MQASIGNHQNTVSKKSNRDLRACLALALTLPMIMPAASLANGGSAFIPGAAPFAPVAPIHTLSAHAARWTSYSPAHLSPSINVSPHFNPLAQTQIVHTLLTAIVPTPQTVSTSSKTATVSAFDLDLSSKIDTVVASQIPGFGSGTVTIKVGAQNLVVSGSTQLTQAEASAVYQVLTTGKQTLIIDASGAASGGSLTIAPAYSQSVDGLSIPKGVSVIDESAGNATLVLNNGLVNNGNLYILSATGSSLPVSLSSPTIDDSKGSLISITLPSSLSALHGYGNGANLDLTTTTLNNGGSIYAPGNLTLTATTIQNDGSITAKSGNLTVQNNGDNLNVNGIGTFNAGRVASFNVLSSANNVNPNLSINGNSIAAKTVDFNDASGALNVNAAGIAGGINSTANTVYINSTNSALNILSINASGDPTFTSVHNIVLSAADIKTVNQPFTILSGGNVTTSDSAKDTMDASSLTGNGGDITIGAGVTFIDNGGGGATITGASTTGGSIKLPGISLNTNSADITLVANQGTTAKSGTISILNVTASGAGLGLYHDGGNITITADGNITTSKITSTGLAAASGDGGVVTITSRKGSVTTSDISVNGGSGTPGGKGTSGAGGDGGDGGDGYDGGALGPNDTIGGAGGYGGAAGTNYGGAGGAGAKNVGDQPGKGSPPNPPTKAGTPLGGTGGNGGRALPGSFAGLDGSAGKDGVDGTDATSNGRDGGDAGKVIITAHTSISTGKITAVGGAGGGGGSGGDGGSGGNGGGGGYGGLGATATGTGAAGSPGQAGGNGGAGGTGGEGGDGTDGGNGGNGGIVTLTAGTTISSKGIDVSGGAGGSGGKGGKGGDGGYGGDGGAGGQGGSGGPDGLAWMYGYNSLGEGLGYIAVLEYQATSNSGDGAIGGAGGNGGDAGDGGSGGSGGKGGIGGNAGTITLNAGTTVSVTSIARAGGAGGNGGAAGQGGQFGKGGDGGDGGDGGGTSAINFPAGTPPSPASSYNGAPVVNASQLPGNPPYSSSFGFSNGNVQGAGGAGGAGGDGGKNGMSGDGGSGGDAGIGGVSGNLAITAAKNPTIGSQIFFNGPSGVAGAGASFGMAPAPGSTMTSTTNPPPVFTQTGKGGTGGMGVMTTPFLPLAPNPNPGSATAAASGKTSDPGTNGDYGADGSTPTPRGGSGATSIVIAGKQTSTTTKVSVNPPPSVPPIVASWGTFDTAQGSQSLFAGLVHASVHKQTEEQEASHAQVHSDFAGAMAETANTSTVSGTTANNSNSNVTIASSTMSSITGLPVSAALTQSNFALANPSLTALSSQTIAGINDINTSTLPKLALLPLTYPPFQLGVSMQGFAQPGESRQFYRAIENQTVDFGDTKISLLKGSRALILRKGGAISVYNLGDGKKGEITITVGGHKLDLGIGQQALVSSAQIDDFAEVNPEPKIVWRTPRLQLLPDGKRVFAANFSIASALQKLYGSKGEVAGLEALDANVTSKMIKNAAILASLTGTDYVQPSETNPSK